MPMPGSFRGMVVDPSEISAFSILLGGVALVAGGGWLHAVARGRAMARKSEALSHEIDRLRQDLREMEEAASHDRLTGAWNRRRFEEALAAEISLASRRRAPLSLTILDLDHFKRINDTHGHATGDAVLVGAAATFRSVLRTSDALVRWGGDEFIILSPATGLEGAINLAERLRAALLAAAFPAAGPITLSAGVTEYLEGESIAALMERADKALYRAKVNGRDQVVGDPDSSDRASLPPPNLLELVWEETYSSGHHLIDEQHILLFNQSNALFTALLEGRPSQEVEVLLEALLIHAEAHFRDEEGLLRKARYPDLETHQAIHADLLARARRLQADLKSGQADFGRMVGFLANDLVKRHLLTEDRNYFHHLMEVEAAGLQA